MSSTVFSATLRVLLLALLFPFAAAYGQSGDTFEVDDTATVARLLPLNNTVQNRNLHVNTDKDWIKLYLEAGQTVTVTARGTYPNSTVLFTADTYLGVPGSPIFQSSKTFRTSATQITITNTLPGAYNYLLRVMGPYTSFPVTQSAYSLQAVSSSGGGNQPPTVALTAPTSGSSMQLGQSLTLTANASDPDGSVSKVDIGVNGVTQSSPTSAPYSYTWTPSSAGSYTVTAQAFDNLGASSSVASATVTVTSGGGGSGASGTLSSLGPCTLPAGGSGYCTVQVAIAFSNTPIACLWIRSPDAVFGCWTVGGNYDFPYASALPGTQIELRAHSSYPDPNNLPGALAASSSLATAIAYGTTNTPPSVSLTAPANGASFPLGQSITLSANASDADGISRVEFLDNGSVVRTATTAPYSVSWSGAALGSHSISARAFDNRGASSTSAAVSITVTNATTPTGSVSTNGPCALAPPGTGYCTVQLSVAFNNTPVACIWGVSPQNLFGCWSEGGSYAYPYATAAPGTQLELRAHAGYPDTNNLPAAYSGSTLLASTSAIGIVNSPPTVSLTAPTGNSTVQVGQTVTLAATAADADGNLARVEFLANNAVIGTVTSTPYTYAWVNPAAGQYTVTARAVDVLGAQTTSSAANLIVTAATGTLTTLGPCSLPGPNGNATYCTVQMHVAFANTPIACVWNKGAELALYGCYTVEGDYDHVWASLTPLNIELRAHPVYPQQVPGWPDNMLSVYNSTPLLASTTISAVNGSTGSISITATPSSNLVAPATTRLSATISGGVSVQSVEYRYQGQAICPAVSVAPYNCDWSQLAAGSYSVTAIATLNSGSPLTSSVLNLTVAHASGPTEGYVFHHTDARGSIVATTDQYGKIAALPSYRAFGRPVNNNPVTPPVPAPPINGVALGFTGKWYDAELQLSNHGARHYDPLYSRFVSIDPANIDASSQFSVNRYLYANDNPYRYVDRNGMWAEDAVVGAASLSIGTVSLINNVSGGYYGLAAVDALGLIFDAILVATPGIPAGTGLMIQYERSGKAAAEVGVRLADDVASPLAGSIRNANPTRGTHNCVNCAIATDAILAGNPAVARPGTAQPISVLSDIYNATWGPKTTISAITRELELAGNGARGIIFGSRGNDVGHVFNVVNQGGKVRFLDGQTGRAAELTGYDDFQLLWTN